MYWGAPKGRDREVVRWKAARRRGALGVAVLVLGLLGALLYRFGARHAGHETDPSTRIADPVALVAREAPRPTKIVTFGMGCMTSRCHAEFSREGTVHEPIAAKACDQCHGPDMGGHVYPIVKAGDSLCMDCHQGAIHGAFSHRDDGERACLSCHVPHASGSRGLLAAGSTAQLCAGCHAAEQGPHSHAMFANGRCEDCHEVHGATDPLLLKAGAVAEQCGSCHEGTRRAMETGTHTHRDVKGSCGACHTGHGSREESLLKAPVDSLCVSCHEEVGRVVATAVVSHDAVLRGHRCVSCHDPHGANKAHMLRGEQAPVCLSCHDRPLEAHGGRTIPNMASILAGSPVAHGPVRSGDCSACHVVHGGAYSRLLKADSEAEAGVMRPFALCLTCHDPALVTSESAEVTSFRNGGVNLHKLHREKGQGLRACSDCHAVHAGNRPRLVADSVAYDGSAWMMPLNFIPTTDGGSCAPGCHELMRYSRGARAEGGSP